MPTTSLLEDISQQQAEGGWQTTERASERVWRCCKRRRRTAEAAAGSIIIIMSSIDYWTTLQRTVFSECLSPGTVQCPIIITILRWMPLRGACDRKRVVLSSLRAQQQQPGNPFVSTRTRWRLRIAQGWLATFTFASISVEWVRSYGTKSMLFGRVVVLIQSRVRTPGRPCRRTLLFGGTRN